ncbi:MAG: translocation/assembly module TamB domain-containing protein, partial [Chitinophagaceae bacterium]|nr:translocation/assembly module TamB domain-containing protein [Chitinophagaceae bacterium]
LSGKMDGTVDNMKGEGLNIVASKSSFKGNAEVIGLPDIDNTTFNIQTDQLLTSGNDLNKLIPQTKVDGIDWKKLERINYKGQYTGSIDNFNAKGYLATTLGNADLNLHMDFRPKIATYKGTIDAAQFDIGKLIKQSTLGKVSIRGDLEGKGFDLNSLDAKVNAVVSSFDLDGKNYKDITINGLVSRKMFDGIFVSQDPKLALNFKGKLDLSGKQPSYNFTSRFIKLDLQSIGLTKEPMIGSGYATLNFTGDNIDNFLGSADLKNVMLESKQRTIYVDRILLESNLMQGEKILTLKSSLADANLKGKFNISLLADAFQLYLSYYLPQYIKKPAKFADQAFVFDAQIKEVDSIVHLFMPDLHGISQTVLNGKLNTQTQSFALDASFPKIGYQQIFVDSMFIVGAGDFSSFDLNTTSKALSYKDEVIIPSFQINTVMANDTASLTINTQSINSILGDATLSCRATASNSNLYVKVLPSAILLNDIAWNFSSNGDLIFGKRIYVKDFLIETGPQRIAINTQNEATDDLVFTLENIDLENISSMIDKTGPSYIGHVNGQARLRDFVNHPVLEADIYTNDYLRVNQDTVGLVKAKIKYDIESKVLWVDKQTSIQRDQNTGFIEGTINAKDSSIHLNTEINDLSIGFVNQFLSEYIQNIKGSASGKVSINGALANPEIRGRIDLKQASLKVLFLGTSYFIDEAKFNFNNQRIEMNDLVLKDERNGNYSGLVKGYISHNNFSDFFLNFSVSSDDLLCLNTVEYDNELFYGYVPAKIKAKVSGELNDVFVDITAKPLKGSTFHLPINSTGDASSYDYIRFAEIGRAQNELDKKNKKPTYLNLNMNIEAT